MIHYKILDSLRVIQSLNFSSSKVDICFSSDATLCVKMDLIKITLVNGIRVVIKKRGLTQCTNCVKSAVYNRSTGCALIQYLQNKVHVLQY